MFRRLVFSAVTLAFPGLAVGDGHVRNLTAVTAPTLRKLSATTKFAGIFFVTVALTALRLAIWDGGFRDLAVDAAPTVDLVRFTASGRYFSGRIALATSLLADSNRRFDDLPVNAAPAFLGRSTILERFVFGRVALTSPLPTHVRGGQDRGDAGGSVDAAPTIRRWSAMFLRFFLGRVALAARLFATGHGGQPDVSLVAAPTLRRRTMLERLVFATVASSLVFLASRG